MELDLLTRAAQVRSGRPWLEAGGRGRLVVGWVRGSGAVNRERGQASRWSEACFRTLAVRCLAGLFFYYFNVSAAKALLRGGWGVRIAVIEAVWLAEAKAGASDRGRDGLGWLVVVGCRSTVISGG